MGIFERMAAAGHEQVVFCYDRTTGMRAIVALHDTTMGPARGGTRWLAGASEDEALDAALRLSATTTAKLALTGLPRGGGQAVLLDPAGGATTGQVHDRDPALRVFGRFVQLLAGRFGTGPDLGTSNADMAAMARETAWVWPVDEGLLGGDRAPLAVQAVLVGMAAAVGEAFGTTDLGGRSVLVQGLGPSGVHLARALRAAGATVLGTDPDPARAKAAADQLAIELVDPDAAYGTDCDVFSPNAGPGVLDETTIPRLRCRVVAGGAAAQLATPADGARLHERGILYAPDWVLTSVTPHAVVGVGELGHDAAQLTAAVRAVADSLHLVFERARADGIPTAEAAERIVADRLAAATSARGLAAGPGR